MLHNMGLPDPPACADMHLQVFTLPACLQIPLAFMILLDPAFFKDTIFAGNDFSTLVMAISAGYFLYDTLEVGDWDLWCWTLSPLVNCTA